MIVFSDCMEIQIDNKIIMLKRMKDAAFRYIAPLIAKANYGVHL